MFLPAAHDLWFVRVQNCDILCPDSRNGVTCWSKHLLKGAIEVLKVSCIRESLQVQNNFTPPSSSVALALFWTSALCTAIHASETDVLQHTTQHVVWSQNFPLLGHRSSRSGPHAYRPLCRITCPSRQVIRTVWSAAAYSIYLRQTWISTGHSAIRHLPTRPTVVASYPHSVLEVSAANLILKPSAA